MIVCSYCGDALDPESNATYQLIVGWERKALGSSRKSGSDIVCRQRREKFACDGCVRRIKMGLAPTQGSLL